MLTIVKLLQGEAWEALRLQVCRTLSLEALPQKEMEQLGQQLDAAYQRTAQHWSSNSAVRLETENGRDTLTLSHLDKLEESESFLALKRQVNALLPRVDLPSVLLEIQAKTGFIDEFTHCLVRIISSRIQYWSSVPRSFASSTSIAEG